MVVCAALASDARVRYTGKLKIVDAVIRDETGSLRVTWFNMMYLKDVLRSGKRYVFKGKLSVSRFGMVLEQPVIYAPETYVPLIGKLRPIYSLPFALTGAQKRCYQEILADLTGPKLMNRLVQGDVGSGKTIVALLALMQMAYGGYQGALMAPTEVLARQHYENFTRLFAQAQINLRVELLTGSMTAKEKREAYGRIAAHETDIVVGTHAVIQDKVHFARLGLVITDEQHRFGVRQRENLAGKGQEGMEQGRQQSLPHVLVMSATPIPRTLAIILYGDLDISVIDEKPVGRLPIKNCVIGASRRKKAYEFITNQVKEGRQAYVICPMVEDSSSVEGRKCPGLCQKAGRRAAALHCDRHPARADEAVGEKPCDRGFCRGADPGAGLYDRGGSGRGRAKRHRYGGRERRALWAGPAPSAAGTHRARQIPVLLYLYQRFRRLQGKAAGDSDADQRRL